MSAYNCSSEKAANICDLHDYVLDYIFQFLLLEDLDNLAYVCKRFHHIVNTHSYARKSANLLLTGHHWKTCSRVNGSTSNYRKRIRLFENWRYGKYREAQLFYHPKLYFSSILLEKSMLYMTHRGVLKAHQRTKRNNMVQRKASWTLGLPQDPDITWIVKKGQVFFGGQDDGSCFIHDEENEFYIRQHLIEDTITSVDFEADLFVCTTKSKTTSFWSGIEEMGNYMLRWKRNLNAAYQTIQLSPNGGTQLAAGKYHDRAKNALKLIDVET